MSEPPPQRRRIRARVDGTVQGVGFRPFVYRLATELALGGHVLNDARGVVVEVEGAPAAVQRFLELLSGEPPPLAMVERVLHEEIAPSGEAAFSIVQSDRAGEAAAPVSADTATCDDCLAELMDPSDRRHRYPFINCTNCGPRFTIVRGVPYDRPLTTMAGFRMCPACDAEYHDPLNRRFHAQPNACPDCGPSLRLAGPAGGELAGDPLAVTARALRDGRIVAVKGVGGFHLACRAGDETAVATLRARKHREDKPFALMAPDLEAARSLVVLGPEEQALLCHRARPIVLAPRRPDAAVAPSVAPGNPDLGVMLPYTPLHSLLLADAAGPLVMTSGNVSDEPIAFRDGDALERLAGIADLFLLHDRPIHTRTDDSVVRVVGEEGMRRPLLLRRSRGHVPDSLPLPGSGRHLLSCGAELKNTFCLAKGGRAWVGHHIGDLQNFETLESFTEGIAHFERLFAVRPEVIAHDLHPEYLSTKYAMERDGARLIGVQHHHAHLAACLAEHGEARAAVGAIFDGTGFGLDGSVWGGELLVGDLAGFDRAGRLLAVALPGGDRAVREPWRMACSWLIAALGEPEPAIPAALAGQVEPATWLSVARLAPTRLAPSTTSAGRLFDAVAALAGVRARVNYEGQAAIEFQAACDPGEAGAYEIEVAAGTGEDEEGSLVLDPRGLIRAVLADVAAGVALGVVSARFHNGVAGATAEACAGLAAARGLDTVVLSGGVFQNRILLERTAARLSARGLRVLWPERLPPNDGGISYGQAAVAAALLERDG